MDSHAVQAWLDAYVDAWKTHDPASIGDLFAEDATYAFHPWEQPVRGRREIVAAWLSSMDEPGSWEGEYRPFVVDGDRAVAIGETRYSDARVYVNSWQLTFDRDGRCSEFVEWYMRPPTDQG